MYPKLGDICMANLPYSENVQSGLRPVIVAQNNMGNKHANLTYVIPLTSKIKKANMTTHVFIEPNEANGLSKNSVAIVENLRPLPKDCLLGRIGCLSLGDRKKVGDAMRVQFPFVS